MDHVLTTRTRIRNQASVPPANRAGRCVVQDNAGLSHPDPGRRTSRGCLAVKLCLPATCRYYPDRLFRRQHRVTLCLRDTRFVNDRSNGVKRGGRRFEVSPRTWPRRKQQKEAGDSQRETYRSEEHTSELQSLAYL